MAKTNEDFSATILKVIDKLAGRESDLKLTFQDLTLEVGMVKTTLNGSIVLDVVFAAEKK
ncbi:MAG TPA: hypothetical protein VJL33_03660 [Candidatus Bathyarchaeia archaeon]|nr:hypothetical protein [Candidatus Bathyarchaeia archaeon]